MTPCSMKDIAATAYSLLWIIAGAGWLIGHYVIERHGPELWILLPCVAFIAYGAWRLQKGDLRAFSADVGKAYRDFKGKPTDG